MTSFNEASNLPPPFSLSHFLRHFALLPQELSRLLVVCAYLPELIWRDQPVGYFCPKEFMSPPQLQQERGGGD